jgi:chaperonin GroES
LGRLESLPRELERGNTAIYAKFTGDEVELEEKRYLIIWRGDVLAVIR